MGVGVATTCLHLSEKSFQSQRPQKKPLWKCLFARRCFGETDSLTSWTPGNRLSVAVSHGKGLPSGTYLTQKYKTTGPDFLGKSCSSTRRSSWSQFKCPLAKEETVLSLAPKSFLTPHSNEVWGVTKCEPKCVLFALDYCMIFEKHTINVWGAEAVSSWQCFSLGIELLKFNLSGWKLAALSNQDSPKCYKLHLFITGPWSSCIIKSLSRFSLEILMVKSFHDACSISLKAKPDSTTSDSLFNTHMPAIASLGLPSPHFFLLQRALEKQLLHEAFQLQLPHAAFLLPRWYLLLFSPII